MSRYGCTKEFFLEKYDEEGFRIENKYLTVPVGSVWELDEDDPAYNIIADKDCVHLERVYKSQKAKSRQWIEITKERLAEHFEKIS